MRRPSVKTVKSVRTAKSSLATLLVALLAVFALACGPSGNEPDRGDGDGDGDGDSDPNAPGSVSGTVWAPGNAPGMVPTNHEIPISGALVYLSESRPGPIPDGAYCQECENVNGVLTDDDGNFTISNVFPNTYWLVVQKGQFRIETQIITAPKIDMPLSAAETTLPSRHDPDNGMWTPRVAIAPGTYDALEDILGKMGLGEVDGSGAYVPSSAAGHIDVWSNGGDIDSVAMGTLTDLVSSLDSMMQYHIIFIPCGGTAHVAALQDQANLQNIRDYVAAGGKLYVTDWSGEWADNVFPEQLELWNGDFSSTGTDTPANAYDATANTWDTTLFGDADGSPSYTSNGAEAVDTPLRGWLDGQEGPMVSGGTGFYNAGSMEVTGNWNHIDKIHTVEKGVDDEGNPVFDEPKAWVIGDDGRAGGKKPLTVSFEPAGCGRVVYSTYHTTHNTHAGLMPQERILLYLIMEIGVCTEDPIIE